MEQPEANGHLSLARRIMRSLESARCLERNQQKKFMKVKKHFLLANRYKKVYGLRQQELEERFWDWYYSTNGRR